MLRSLRSPTWDSISQPCDHDLHPKPSRTLNRLSHAGGLRFCISYKLPGRAAVATSPDHTWSWEALGSLGCGISALEHMAWSAGAADSVQRFLDPFPGRHCPCFTPVCWVLGQGPQCHLHEEALHLHLALAYFLWLHVPQESL